MAVLELDLESKTDAAEEQRQNCDPGEVAELKQQGECGLATPEMLSACTFNTVTPCSLVDLKGVFSGAD